MTLLYLFVNEEESAVKIGVSNSPHNRAAPLPVAINRGRSLEIEFDTGSATSVERILHYFFRQHKHGMPIGDGCSEWFKIDALQQVTEFLETEGTRLGIREIRPLLPPLPLEVGLAKTARLQMKAAKLEARRIKDEARSAAYARELASAAEHNARLFDWIQRTFQNMFAADLVVGILAPVKSEPLADGHLYLRGEGGKLASDEIFKNARVIGLGYCHVFTGSFYSSTCELTEISIAGQFTKDCLPQNYEQREPGSEKIRAYLHSLVTRAGSPEQKSLLRVQTEVGAMRSRFWDDVHEEWNQMYSTL